MTPRWLRPTALADRDDLELVYASEKALSPSTVDVVGDVVHYLAGALGGRGLVWHDSDGLFVFVPKEFVR